MPPAATEHETFQYYLETQFPQYLNNGDGGEDAKHFTIFDDNPEHPNMEPFYRFQLSGNCFLQAPILMIWYLTLWYDSGKTAAEAPLMHISRYARNTFESKFLYEYLFDGAGGESWSIVRDLIADRTRVEQMIHYSSCTYEEAFEYLTKYGPALVELDNLPVEDFSQSDKFHYKVLPKMDKTTKKSGHTMLLVGVRKDEFNQLFFLLQNWWEGKLFVEVRSNYLSTVAGTRQGFQFIVRPFELVDDTQLFGQSRTGEVRNAQSSPLLERPFRHRGVPQRS